MKEQENINSQPIPFPGNYNPCLIRFTNGILDFTEMRFKPYNDINQISLSTNYDFIHYENDSPEILELNRYLTEIIPLSSSRLLFLEKISLMLRRGRINLNLYGNFSSLITMLDKSFGMYSDSLSNINGNNYIGKRILITETPLSQTYQEYLESIPNRTFGIITCQNTPIQSDNILYIECNNPTTQYNLDNLKSAFMWILWTTYKNIIINRTA